MNGLKKFVIQRHERQNEPLRQAQGRSTHWDLMLETGDFLETYRIGKPPEQWGSEPIEVVRIFDHSLNFLTYEGPVNKGKGDVKIADRGTYSIVTKNMSRLIINFDGIILRDEFTFATGGDRARRE